jgi:hypothetical protein
MNGECDWFLAQHLGKGAGRDPMTWIYSTALIPRIILSVPFMCLLIPRPRRARMPGFERTDRALVQVKQSITVLIICSPRPAAGS